MNPDFFTQIQSACSSFGWQSHFEPANAVLPFDVLQVVVPNAQGEPAFRLRVIALAPPGEAQDRSGTVDMLVTLPFKVAPAQFADTARCVSSLSVTSTLGHFCLSEVDGLVVQRYTWTVPLADMQARYVVPLMRSFVNSAIELTPLIEPVATGKRRYDDVVAQARIAYERVMKQRERA